MPAAVPDAERPDGPPVKTIQTTIKSKITPAVSVRTRAPPHAVPRGPRAQHQPCRYSPTTLADSLIAFRTKPIHHFSHVQVNDAPQSAPAGHCQLASARQARRMGPPWPTDSPMPRRERRISIDSWTAPLLPARCMLTNLRCLCLRHSSLRARSSAPTRSRTTPRPRRRRQNRSPQCTTTTGVDARVSQPTPSASPPALLPVLLPALPRPPNLPSSRPVASAPCALCAPLPPAPQTDQ